MVLLDTVKELLSALRVFNVFNADVYALFDIAVPDDFVNDHTDSVWCYVVDDAGATICLGLIPCL
jgi:hypothetical protein